MRLFDLHLPAPILTFTSLVGSANTFLAMLMIGIGLELRLPNHKYAAAARYLGVRYGWAIVFALVTWFLLPLDHPSKVVLTMVYFAPIASMIPGFTQENGGDVELSSFMNGISIVVAMISMPLLAAVVKG